MDSHITDHFSEFSDKKPEGRFHKVLPLHNMEEADWEELHSVSQSLPRSLPRGWFELSRLVPEDRIEFSREFWLATLPYQVENQGILASFFDRLDDIGVFVIQETVDDPFDAQLVYSIKDNGGFFHGYPPAIDDEVTTVQESYPDMILPADYLAFFQIHNGFSKYLDTGLMPTFKLFETYKLFQEFLLQQPPLEVPKDSPKGAIIDPKTLIPFYESFGQHCYQCFWSEWYPEQEMGNVYYSGIEKTLSNVEKADASTETLAFSTFLDWLGFYLEAIDE